MPRAELGTGDVVRRGAAAKSEAAVAAAGAAGNLARLVDADAQVRVREREGAGAAGHAGPDDRHVDAARMAVLWERGRVVFEPVRAHDVVDASGLTGNVGHAPWPAITLRQSPRSPLSRLSALPADDRGLCLRARELGSRQRHRPDNPARTTA